MIEIGPGVELGLGVKIGDIPAFPAYFITEVAQDYITTETGDKFIEE